MSRSKPKYLDSEYSSHGSMVCDQCGEKIRGGHYRFHEDYKRDAYVTVHRSCCSGDAGWQRFDEEAEAYRVRKQEYRAACRDFVAKWGVPEIEDLEDALAAGEAGNG